MESMIVYETSYEKVRIGKLNDGGYVICKLPGTYDIVISGGISDDISFESHLCSEYNDLKCIAFDGSINNLPNLNDKITFVKKYLGKDETETTTNLKAYLSQYKDVFMKIDIEGHEFRIIPELGDFMNRVKQLVIEIHTPGDITLHPDYFKGLHDIDHPFMFKMFELINKTHTLVHFHANNGCKMHSHQGFILPNVFECTFIRNDFVTTKVPNSKNFPTELDMPNCSYLSDYTIDFYPFVCKP